MRSVGVGIIEVAAVVAVGVAAGQVAVQRPVAEPVAERPSWPAEQDP